MFDRLRARIARRATGMFKHAEYPLADTLRHRGDPGLCGPGSVSWQVIGDPAAFAGGIRALLVQAAHPEVAAGVADHSRYREDPLGRLSRTSNYVTAATYGAMPEVKAAVAVVKQMHARVRGSSHRGVRYAADVPGFAAWVHNALTESFLVTHQAFGPGRMSVEDADLFVREQHAVGRMLDADPLPETAAELRRWMAEHHDLDRSPGQHEAVAFLRDPPLSGSVRFGYGVLQRGAVATMPARTRRLLGLRRWPGAVLTARFMIGFLRWALGSSPSWNLALVRVNAPIPEGRFRQPLPIDSLEDWGRQSVDRDHPAERTSD